MTAIAERRWGILRRLRPATRTATPGPDLTPAGAAVTDSHVYASAAYLSDPGQTTTALGHAAAPGQATEVGERTGIIVRFDADPGQPAEGIPPLADGAELLPAAILNALISENGFPVWFGEPTDVEHAGQAPVWNLAGVA